jgi:hypothetical protein
MDTVQISSSVGGPLSAPSNSLWVSYGTITINPYYPSFLSFPLGVVLPNREHTQNKINNVYYFFHYDVILINIIAEPKPHRDLFRAGKLKEHLCNPHAN